MGVSRSETGDVPKSSNDEAKGFPAVHATIRCHLRNHALRTLPCISGGADLDLALTKAHQKSCGRNAEGQEREVSLGGVGTDGCR